MLFPAGSTNLVVVFPPPEIGEERMILPRPLLEKGESIVTVLRGSSRTIWREKKKKSQNKNFDDHITTI